MNVFLKIASALRGTYVAQLFCGRLQKFCDVLLDQFTNSGLLQRSQQIGLLDVGESAA